MPDTVVDTTATTDTLPEDTSVEVTIDTLGDHDWYAVTLVAGTTYVFHTTAIPGQNPDTFLNLRNGSGTVIASDDDGGDGTYSVLRFTATASGTFYIDAGTYDNLSTGSYHLSMTALPPTGSDLLPASTATTGTLAVTGSVGGQIDTSGDHDWYAITLTAGETYMFRTGATTPNGTADTTLTLRDAAGTEITSNDDAGEATYSAVRFTATTSGTYYLDVGAFGTSTGGFVLTAFTVPPLTLYSNDQIANQLTNGFWGGSDRNFNVTAGGTITYDVTRLTAEGVYLANEAFALWSDATGITFTAVTSGAQIVLDDNQSGAFSNSSVSGGFITSSTVNVSTAWLSSYGTGLNSYSLQTYIHEIGHAIGLGHAGNYNGAASYASDALYLNDAWSPTIMSYFSQSDNSYFAALGFTAQFVLTPMIADAIATTTLYGTPTTTRTGDTVYGFNNTSGRAVYDATANPSVAYTVHDNGGTDTLDYSGYSQNQRIDLNEETFSNVGGRVGNVAIARGTVIENAIGGSGNDTLIGNAAANALEGRGGADTLDGRGGGDTMTGGTGDDIYIVDNLADVVVELAGEGFDSVRTSIDLVADSVNFAEVESFELTGSATQLKGNWFNNTLIANASLGSVLVASSGNDVLIGGDGNDSLNGGTGDDTMTGGLGDDSYFVYELGDTITELENEGTDYVRSGVNWTLGAYVENLRLAGAATEGIGNALANTLWGGREGATLSGLDGDDTIYGSNKADTINGGNGLDTLFGNAGVDTIYGGADNDTINGGGNGDLLYGDGGEDTLRGGNGNDQLWGGIGNDTLNGELNNDTLRGEAGEDSLNGGDGIDILIGGADRDIMTGGLGADDFVFDEGDFAGLTASTADRITDFSVAGGDDIDLSAIDAIAGGADDMFTYLGNAAFSNVAGQLRWEHDGGNTMIYLDIDGDALADYAIRLDGNINLLASSFIL